MSELQVTVMSGGEAMANEIARRNAAWEHEAKLMEKAVAKWKRENSLLFKLKARVIANVKLVIDSFKYYLSMRKIINNSKVHLSEIPKNSFIFTWPNGYLEIYKIDSKGNIRDFDSSKLSDIIAIENLSMLQKRAENQS